MNCVLAFSVPLAEEVLSQTACFGERAGIRGVAAVHHLIGNEKSLEASLVSLSKFLRRKRNRGNEYLFSLNLTYFLSNVLGWVYLYDVSQQLKISQQLAYVPVKHHQLCLLYRKPLVWIWGCYHGALASSKEPITGYLHIKGDAEESMNIFYQAGR